MRDKCQEYNLVRQSATDNRDDRFDDTNMTFNPAHPGEVLKDYLGGMTVKEAAARLRVTRATLSRILNGHAGITAGMSLRLSSALGTSPEFWLKMRVQYGLWHV
jgi:antitoxin HigA-1